MSDTDTSSPGWLKRFEGWPLIGRLWEVPKEALREARVEVAYATFYSTMPFWFLPLIGGIIFLQRPSLWLGISGGELLVYASALIGPLAYIITKRYGRFKIPDELEERTEEGRLSYPFPYGRLSFYLATVLCILSGFVFTVQRLKADNTSKQLILINENGLVWLSLVIALLATLLLFCVTAYRNLLDALEKKHSEKISLALKNDEDQAYEAWIERKQE